MRTVLVLVGIFFFVTRLSASDCSVTSIGQSPLNSTVTYQGFPGYLYPDGNFMPAYHNAKGQELAKSFLPLDSAGNIDSVNGCWVFLSVGMSNTSAEFNYFISQLNLGNDTTLNRYLRVVNGAQGSQTADKIRLDTASFWDTIDARLAVRGLSRKQVQVIWLKEANANPTQPFPIHAIDLRDDLRDIVRLLPDFYPNIRQVFLSSRIYAGYALTTLNPEPYAFESGFSVKWLIESQISGNDSLNYDPDSGAVTAPWLGWGPYLWSDGTTNPLLPWNCSDFQSDGTHPSTFGQAKVSSSLTQFLRGSDMTKPWFTSPTACCVSTRGNVDCDPGHQTDIADLTRLVDHLFISFTPICCEISGDLVADNSIDIGDLTLLVDHLFISFSPLAPCQ
jgi:hypothetical protein